MGTNTLVFNKSYYDVFPFCIIVVYGAINYFFVDKGKRGDCKLYITLPLSDFTYTTNGISFVSFFTLFKEYYVGGRLSLH